MHVYIPLSDYVKSARVLSNKHLRSNLKDAHQIIHGKMPNMPCSMMWMGSTKSLKIYFNTMLSELKVRGHKHMFDVFNVGGVAQMPLWLGDPKVHVSHIVNLLRQDFPHYGNFFEVPQLDYPAGHYWPTANGVKSKADTEAWGAFFQFYPGLENRIEVFI